ncbi:MAG: sugar phosphate isomerase/epimerase [Lentisphaerae bacterium]|jgi:D-psicose/D-tagatose/L-ribulose 3-epimerase|nr:sugar phosphate isomerase/epimerase [Lentisphaerota bacterium]
MVFGICSGPEIAQAAKDAGFGFLESSVAAILKPGSSEAEFEDSIADVLNSQLPITNLNVLLPGGMIIAGPEADIAKAVAYCTIALQRAKKIGIESICFGSGTARRCPEGWKKEDATSQIREFLSELAPVATGLGVPLTIENLNTTETNMLCTVAECADMARSVNSPGVLILVDGYHWMKDSDIVESIIENGDLIGHTHIATIPSRAAPGLEPCDFSAFADALRDSGFNGKMSIEGRIDDKSAEGLKSALETLNSIFA